MQVAVREKHEDMIVSRFAPIVALAKLLHTQRRDEVQQELEEELGLTAARKELFILTAKADAIAKKIKEIAGEHYHKDSPLNMEIDRRMRAEDTIYSRIEAALKEQKEAVWLSGAPAKMVESLAELDKIILPKFMKELEKMKNVLLPGGGSKIKKIKLPRRTK